MLACVGCDQITKNVAKHTLAKSGTIRFLNGAFHLHYVENPGALLGLGATIPENVRHWIFIGFVGFFLAAILGFLLTSELSRPQSIALSLVLSGGVSNLIDRIANEGRVIDFMTLGIGSLRTGVFNVADVAIAFGCAWFFAITIGKREDAP